MKEPQGDSSYIAWQGTAEPLEAITVEGRPWWADLIAFALGFLLGVFGAVAGMVVG